MKREAIAVGKTIEDAIKAGLKELGVEADAAEYEVLEQPKKGFLGFGESPAKVKVTCNAGPEILAMNFVNTLVKNMELDVQVELQDEKENKRIVISGESAGVLIGHHGETLDALQYLVNLSANRGDDDEHRSYSKITVDIENYRAKREETLRTLARRMAARVNKTHRNIALEPMNPYERRIIHSEVQNIAGVMTYSVGADENRKIIICPEDKAGKGHKSR